MLNVHHVAAVCSIAVEEVAILHTLFSSLLSIVFKREKAA